MREHRFDDLMFVPERYQDGDAVSAKFFSPTGLGIDKQGNIYVADLSNHRIRKISFE